MYYVNTEPGREIGVLLTGNIRDADHVKSMIFDVAINCERDEYTAWSIAALFGCGAARDSDATLYLDGKLSPAR